MAWGPKDSTQFQHALDPVYLSEISSYSALVDYLLNHVRKVAPGLSVPQLTPRVVVGSVLDAAGLFHESDGWVTLNVNKDFFLNRPAAFSILCHEMCHYVLGANGIREPVTLVNERLTDVAMFVFGLGDVFLNGYRSDARQEYSLGHRLGYLSDAEYRYVDDLVFEYWASSKLQITHEERLEKTLKTRIQDSSVRCRLLEAAHRKHPQFSKAKAIQFVLDQYEHDRRC